MDLVPLGSAALLLAALAPVLGVVPLMSTRRAVRPALVVGPLLLATLAAAVLGLTTLSGPVAVTLELGGTLVAGLAADRMRALLAVLTTGVGLVAVAFTVRALRGDPRERRFLVLAGTLTTAATIVALAGTLAVLLVAWLVVTATLAGLVAHHAPTSVGARGAATQTWRTLAIGDAALVAAAGLVAASAGNVDLRNLRPVAGTLAAEQAAIGAVTVSALDAVAVLLVIAGIARSALVPLHRWLPATLAAPTPVSALLHAGVVNGAGVLLLLFAPVFGASRPATALVFVVGVLTAVLATGVSRLRPDIKGSLAWSTAGQMGFMAVQLAVGAFAAALVHVVGHGMYKAAMFLGAGRAVESERRRRARPSTSRPISRLAHAAVVVIAPTLAVGGALVLLAPDLGGAASTLLVAVFGWATAARATSGWLDAAPFGAVGTAGTAIVAAVVLGAGYVGGVSGVKALVAPDLPTPVAAVPASVLALVIAVLAIGALVLRFAPDPIVVDLRTRARALLLSLDAPTRPRRRVPATVATGRRRTDRLPVTVHDAR